MTAFPQGALLRDHPRVCGEKFYGMTYAQRDAGSPPRVRGKGQLPALRDVAERITPACAGKRFSQPSRTTKTWDHPRVCGEKANLCKQAEALQGSPPRVRGKVWTMVFSTS